MSLHMEGTQLALANHRLPHWLTVSLQRHMHNISMCKVALKIC